MCIRDRAESVIGKLNASRSKSQTEFEEQPTLEVVKKSRVPQHVRKRQLEKDKKRAQDRTKNIPTPKRYEVEKRRRHGYRIPSELRKILHAREVKKKTQQVLYPSCFNGIRGPHYFNSFAGEDKTSVLANISNEMSEWFENKNAQTVRTS